MTFTKHLNALQAVNIERLIDIADIEDGIKYCRELLASYPSIRLAHTARKALCHFFHRAFVCTSDVKYLDKAILAARDDVKFNASYPLLRRILSLSTLISFLLARLDLLRRRGDLKELMELFPIVDEYEHAGFLDGLPSSYAWALVAHTLDHPSTSTAYDRAMSSMQAYVTFSPTLDVQHSRIISRYNILETLPLDYASYQIHTSRLEQAIETLERGRALMWSEMRGLRTSVDRIHLSNPGLAEKFAAVNRNLSALTFSFSPSSNIDWEDSDIKGLDPYGHLVLRQRKIQDDREKLISQIQTLPGFDTFLKPPAFDILRSAASHGPVIIINHSRWRSNIVIILHNALPTLVPTNDDFYSRANKLQDQLLGARMNGLESDKYEGALRSILKELYELVGQPVIKRLKELNVPEQSRVWWCPTSVFCSLPLHAMGPIPSDMSPPQYFLDLYTPSYTPSLSALIESRKPGSHASGKPSILLVAHPDERMPQALKEIRTVQAIGTRVTTLFAARATPTAVLASLRDHPFAHIVCHGILEPGKPFEASFKLHGGKRVLLLDIVRSQLPNAEFAFLSACHTAELTDECIADEMLHLAAAMQFCGFRSVVGTMWAMADIDGRDLARHFYQTLFSDEWQGVRYYERTAVALRDAVAKLRRKGGITLERWVNFVHYGA